MNVFVLTTGRSGSLTFAKACGHLTNYTSGHETRAHLLPPERLAYPDNHIEVDNRLCWFLGDLGRLYDRGRGGKRPLYVHLIRDEEETARSMVRHALPTAERPKPYPANMLRAYAHGLVMNPCAWPDYYPVALSYVRTVNANIREFLNSLTGRWCQTVRIGEEWGFRRVLADIGAEGNIGAAMAAWGRKHNESPRDSDSKQEENNDQQ